MERRRHCNLFLVDQRVLLTLVETWIVQDPEAGREGVGRVMEYAANHALGGEHNRGMTAETCDLHTLTLTESDDLEIHLADTG